MDWSKTLRKAGFIEEGSFHFVGSTQHHRVQEGMHFNSFVHPETLAVDSGLREDIGKAMADIAVGFNLECIVTVGTEMAAIGHVISQRLALPVAYLSNSFKFRDSYKSIVNGKKVGLVMLTLLGTNDITQCTNEVKSAGGKLTLVQCVLDHSQGTISMKAPIKSLVTESYPQWTLNGCFAQGPCSRGVPIRRKPGYGTELEAMFNSGKLAAYRQPKFIN